MERQEDAPIKDDEELDRSSSSDIDKESEALAELIGEEGARLIPPDARGIIAQRLITKFTSVRVPAINPVFRRITSEHISTMLANLDKDRERGHTSEASARKYQFLYFIIGIAVAFGLIIFFSLRDEREIMFTLIVALFSFAGGFGLGLHRGRR